MLKKIDTISKAHRNKTLEAKILKPRDYIILRLQGHE